MPHVGDAMSLFNEAWSKTKRTTVLKCWIKSECLSEGQVQLAREICASLSEVDPDSGHDALILQTDAQSIFQDLSTMSCLQTTQHNAQELIADVQGIENVAELLDVLNSEAAEDNDPSPYEIAINQLQDLYDQYCQQNCNNSQREAIPSSIEVLAERQSIADMCNKITELAYQHTNIGSDENIYRNLSNVLREVKQFISNA